MKPHDNTERFARDAAIRTNEAANERVLGRMHEAYAHTTRSARLRQRPDYWGLVFESRFARLAAVTVILLALATLVGQFGALLSGSGVAWADVTERFESVPFFYASIYMKDYVLDSPRQFELWMGKDGSARMRVGTQVVFGRDGQVTHAFDIRRRCEVEPDETAANIVGILATAGEFSLETVIQSLSGGKLVDVTPAMNARAAIGEDLAVFDAHSAVSPGWVRIYALRETKLPVRLRIWEPGEGFSVDVLIAYAKEQPALFFDPQAFAAKLHEPDQTETSLAYLFLKDPGGQDVTSRDLSR